MKKELSFHTALYETKCIECGYEVEWEAIFDADSPEYRAKCCNKQYFLFPSKVNLVVEEMEEEE